jgi:hypothetical protein
MLLRILFCLAISTFTLCSASAAPVTLAEALEKKWITIQARATGTFGSDALRLTVTNLHKDMELSIPAGWIFDSQDTTMQNMIVVRGARLTLEKDGKKTARLQAYCINAGRRVPVQSQAYASRGPATGPLAELARYIHTERPDEEHIQSAVWAVSDRHNLSGIGHPGLLQSAASILGRPLPEYFIRNGYQPVPGGPAYSYEPLSVEGMFTYRNETGHTVNFGLFKKSGELVEPFFENLDSKPGNHRFKYSFEISGLERGEYAVRLTDHAGRELGTRTVVW